MYFESRFSRFLKVINAAIFALLALAVVLPLSLTWGDVSLEVAVASVLMVSLVIIIIYAFGGRVTGYRIDENSLEIVMWFRKNPVILLNDIESAESSSLKIYKAIRLWGNGGLLGFYGKFKQIGGPKFTAYVTDTNSCVLLKTKKGFVLISPSDRALFLEELNKSLADMGHQVV